MTWGIHHLDGDEVMTPRRGLFLRRYAGKLKEVSLVVWVDGLQRSRHLTDFGRVPVYARTRYWFRLSVGSRRTWIPKFAFCSGTGVGAP